MSWWQRLLSADAPSDATLHAAELGFRNQFPIWAAILLGVAAALGVWFLYAREATRLSPVRRGLLASLRVAAIVVLLMLILRPVLLVEFRGERPRGIALLLDNSKSMTMRDQRISAADRWRVAVAENRVPDDIGNAEPASLTDVPIETTADPARVQLVRSVLTHPRWKLVENLRELGPLQIFLFGQRLERANAKPDSGALSAEEIGDLLKTADSQTALADAVNDLLLKREGDLPAAIVIMSDGRDNASKNTLDQAARECARLGVPLHIYGVGASDVGNLQLKDVAIADTLFYDDAIAVPVRWRSQGFKQGSVEITLNLNGKVVARKTVPAQEGDDFREVLSFTPVKGNSREEAGSLTANIRYSGTEAFTDDNELKKPVKLVDRKVRVLYIENTPRWEYKFLMTALLRDRRVDARLFLVNGDPRALQSGEPYLPSFPTTRQELFSFDLLILGDVPADCIGTEHMNWIRDFVSEGGGLVLIAGKKYAPATFHNTTLAEVLPVDFTPVPFNADAERTQAFAPIRTSVGERSELLTLADAPDENARVWRELPGFYWHYPVTKLRPGAIALLAHPRLKANDQPMPILAAHYFGKGLVLFSGSDETWRWRYNEQDKYFARFWGQVIYQMGLPHLVGNPKRVQLALEKTENVLGKPSYIYARLFDSEFRPLTIDRVTARLDHLDGKANEERSKIVTLDAVAGQPGEYRILLPHDAVGRFALKIDNPEPASLEYRVNLPPQHELAVAGMAEDALRDMARTSGGKFYREENLKDLVASIRPQKASFSVRQEVLLWNWLTLSIFVLLLTAEWVLRKFSNLI